MEGTPDRGFRLGDCRVEPAELQISGARGPEHVEPRVMDVLMTLVAYAGQTVPREEIINRVWATTYIGDEVLSRCISLLRRHLGDSARKPRFIETVPKKGYRLIAPVRDGAANNGERALRQRRDDRHRAIAVLPFVNLSDDPEYEYFSDGMAEELLTLLAKISGLKVAARTSAFYFKDKNVDIRVIGEQLGVGAVLMGSVRHTGNQIRVSAQLIDAASGYHLWSDIYEKAVADFFELQVEISGAIVAALRSAMTSRDGELAARREHEASTSDFKAYQLYLQGKYLFNRRGEKPIRKSIELFEAACARDPRFPHARVALAKAYAVLPFYSGEPRQQAFDLARESACRAIELDEDIGEAHTVLGLIDMHLWRWDAAERAFLEALAHHLNDPSLHQWYGQFLSMVGALDRSLEQILIAYDLDPVSPAVNERLGFTYLQLGKNELADHQFQVAAALGFERSAIVDPYLLILCRMRRFSEMEHVLENIQAKLEIEGDWARRIVRAFEKSDERDAILRSLMTTQLRRGLPVIFAASMVLGAVEVSYETLDVLTKSRNLNVEMLLLPEAEGIRRDARFGDLIRRVGLYDYWEATSWPEILAAR
ncbi:MAG: winged helix-turn-helix domain-containing protein [Gammaproteobacteria bacterium]|nr:winged helix-turn-helix domain-containing protein [Gammaproteobacteria bacterium]